MSSFPAAAHHIALTVTDLPTSRAWYSRLLGSEPALDEDVPALAGHHHGFHHTIFVLPGGTILALHTHRATPSDRRFDELALGYGLSFRHPDRIALEFWAARS